MLSLLRFSWFVGPALNALLLLFMLRRRMARQFPFFFSYCILQILGFFVLFSLYYGHFQAAYSIAYLVLGGVLSLASLIISYELFTSVLQPFEGLRDAGVLLFRWAAAVMIIVALVIASSIHEPTHGILYSIVLEIERCVRVMQCALLLFVLLSSNYLGLSMRNRAYGITLGFGLNASLALTLLAISSRLGPGFDKFLALGTTAAYDLTVLIWLAYAILPESARDIVRLPVSSPLVRWNEIATAMGHGARVAYMPDPETYDLQKITDGRTTR